MLFFYPRQQLAQKDFVERVAQDFYFMEAGKLKQIDSVGALEMPMAVGIWVSSLK